MRRLEHALAGTTILVGGGLLLLFGGTRPVEGARVFVAAGNELRSVRVVALRREHDLESPAEGKTVRLRQGDRLLASGETGRLGTMDLHLDPPLSVPAALLIEVDGREAPLELSASGGSGSPPDLVQLSSEGELRIRATLPRGAIVSPFVEELDVVITDEVGRDVESTVAIEVEGGDPPTARELAPDGRLRFRLRADEPVVRMTLTASDVRGRRGVARGEIRALLGSCVLGRDAPVSVRCPGARPHLFYSAYAEGVRVDGGALDLAPDAQGFPAALLPALGGAVDTVVLSSDASESGASTIAWPAPGRVAPKVVPHLGASAETMSWALRREEARRRTARVASSIVVALGLLASLVLVSRSVGPSSRSRENADEGAGIPGTTRTSLRAAPLALLLAALGVAVVLLFGAR